MKALKTTPPKFFKVFLSLVLSGCLCSGLAPAWAFAEADGATLLASETATGILTTNDGTFTYEVTSSQATITSYEGEASSVTIPSTIEGYTVTAVGWYCFSRSTFLENVVIPNTVTAIGDGAFANCTSLTELVLPAELSSLGFDAFNGCTSLVSIFIPSSLKSCQPRVFEGCSSLKTVTFENDIKEIPNYLFEGSGIERLVIPDTVTAIGNGAFSNCAQLKSVSIPDGVTSVGYDEFSGCTSLVSINLPSTITQIHNGAFSDCKSLNNVVLPSGLKSLGYDAFSGCTSLTSINIPAQLGLLDYGNPYGPFEGCSALKTVNFEEGITCIPYYLFKDCIGLESITIPKTVSEIGREAFSGCTLLANVTLSSRLTSIQDGTFSSCSSLKSVVLPYGITEIGESAFAKCPSLEAITIPCATTSIAGSAFSYPNKTTINGVEGSYAQTYAAEMGIAFNAYAQPATSISLSQSELTLFEGSSQRLYLDIEPYNFTDEVIWQSSNTGVAQVSADGSVRGVGAGTARVKVYVGDEAKTCYVTVNQPVSHISLNQDSVTINALSSCQLKADVYPYNATDTSVVWSSSDEAVAAVDSNGLVAAHKKGKVNITATAHDGSGVQATCEVVVPNDGVLTTLNSADGFESTHNYQPNRADEWVYTSEGAGSLDLTFDDRTAFEEDFDFLYVYNNKGREVGKYTGTQLAGRTINVIGDTVKVKLVSNQKVNDWGFKVTSIVTNEAKPSPSADPNPPSFYWGSINGSSFTVGDILEISYGIIDSDGVASVNILFSIDNQDVIMGWSSSDSQGGQSRLITSDYELGHYRVVCLEVQDEKGFVNKIYDSSYAYAKGLDDVITANLSIYDFDVVPYGGGTGETHNLTLQRLFGNTRYSTMSAIANEGFDDGSCDVAVLATGDNFPDALASSALAGAYSAPIVLTNTSSLSPEAAFELTRLGVKTVYVLGGNAAVSDAVVAEVEAQGIVVERVYGNSRQETSVRIYEKVQSQSASCDTVIIASGSSFADALSISPYAYAMKTPILLTDNDKKLTDAEVSAIKNNANIKNVIIVGGDAVVSDDVVTQLGGSNAYTFTRLYGSDRYITSAKIAEWELAHGLNARTISVATGVNFPDALAGAALTGSKGGLLLLVAADQTTQATGVLSANKAAVETLYVYGGTKVVPDAVVATCKEALE